MGPIPLFLLGAILSFGGLGLVAASLYQAHRRGQPRIGTLWTPREAFVGRELVYNRLGFGLAIAGIAVLLFIVFRTGATP